MDHQAFIRVLVGVCAWEKDDSTALCWLNREQAPATTKPHRESLVEPELLLVATTRMAAQWLDARTSCLRTSVPVP